MADRQALVERRARRAAGRVRQGGVGRRPAAGRDRVERRLVDAPLVQPVVLDRQPGVHRRHVRASSSRGTASAIGASDPSRGDAAQQRVLRVALHERPAEGVEQDHHDVVDASSSSRAIRPGQLGEALDHLPLSTSTASPSCSAGSGRRRPRAARRRSRPARRRVSVTSTAPTFSSSRVAVLGPRDRDDVVALRQHPRQRELRRRHALGRGELARSRPPASRFFWKFSPDEPRRRAAVVVLVEVVDRLVGPGQEPAPQRRVGHQRDPELAQHRQRPRPRRRATTASTRSAPRRSGAPRPRGGSSPAPPRSAPARAPCPRRPARPSPRPSPRSARPGRRGAGSTGRSRRRRAAAATPRPTTSRSPAAR